MHEHLTELAREQAVGEHGLVALDWHSGNRSVLVDHDLSRADRRPDPGHPARGRLPRAARGDRVRHPHDHRGVRGRRCPGQGARGRRRAAEEPAADADLRRRHQPAAVDHRLRRRARRSARRSTPPSRRGRTPTCTPPPRRWAGSTAAATCRTRRTCARLRRALRRVPHAARLLRPRRQRRHAPAQRASATAPGRWRRDERLDRRHRRPCSTCGRRWPTLHAELTRYGSWSPGPPATSRPGCPAAT